jgi:ATP-dependent Clp protease protease subunit|nr:MAG TPA: hypothetical protein [Caudoviricetes sp.]
MEELFELCGNSEMTDDLIQEYLDKRIIIFNKSVDSGILEKIALYILKWNAEDKDIPVDKRKPIWLYTQSPGGSVIAGFNVIDVIASSQTPVYTLCFSQCCSMGFHIFIAGHKRYAFKNSILMMHDGEISVSNSSSKAKDTMKFFDTMEKRIKDYTISRTAIDSDTYDNMYEKEYYMYANDEAKSLGCVDYIIGEDVQLDEIIY